VTWDTVPPATPVLNQPPSPTRNSVLVLDGTVSSDTDVMRIYRNDALLDTIKPNLPALPEFPYRMTLLLGDNRIHAFAVDAAGNESGQSNEILVVLDSSPGLLISQPFVPNDQFLVNLSRPASGVTLRIYDLGGDLVQILRDNATTNNVSIAWDGRNGDDEAVKKGPLVAVAQIQYQSGGKDVFREIFLFEP
jgi:hypothetical protein